MTTVAPPTTSTVIGNGSTSQTVGPLLTVTRIQSIGELLANSVDIEKKYFSESPLTSSDYETFLQVNGVVVSFTDSLGTVYEVPSTYINWPPQQNGYPYQIMGANISLGPFMVEMNLSAQVEYLSGVIEQITGITPSVNLVELSDIYLIEKHAANILESIRENNVNGVGTPAYYSNMTNQIQETIADLLPIFGLTGVEYGTLPENADIPEMSSMPDQVLGY